MTPIITEHKVRVLRALKERARTYKELRHLLGIPHEKQEVLHGTLALLIKEKAIELSNMRDRYYLLPHARVRYTEEVLRDMLRRLEEPLR